MEDTTDKSSAPGTSTDEAAATPLDDKETGQAETDTGASQDGSDAKAGATDDGSGSTEEETNEQTDDDAGKDGEDEGELLTPEQVKNLPPELKATYVSMKKAFDQKMGEANRLIEQAQRPAEKPADDGTGPSPARTAVEAALRRRGVDPKSLSDEHLQSLELVAEVAMEGGQKVAQSVVTPLEQREAKAEVDGYFEKNPDRSKYRSAMGKLDAQTGGRLPLDTLYFAVAGKDLSAAAEGRRDKKLRDAAKGSPESATGTSGNGQGEADIFDEIAQAGGRGKTRLL